MADEAQDPSSSPKRRWSGLWKRGADPESEPKAAMPGPDRKPVSEEGLRVPEDHPKRTFKVQFVKAILASEGDPTGVPTQCASCRHAMVLSVEQSATEHLPIMCGPCYEYRLRVAGAMAKGFHLGV